MDIEQRTVGGNLSRKYSIEMRIIRFHKDRTLCEQEDAQKALTE